MTDVSTGRPALQRAASSRNLLTGSVGNATSLAVVALAGLLNFKICLTYLGPVDYGVVLLVSMVGGWSGLGDLGLATAARQRMTQLLARGRTEDASEVLSSGVFTLAAIALALLAALGILHGVGATRWLFASGEADVPRLATLLAFGVALAVSTLPLRLLDELQVACNDLVTHNAFTIGGVILRPILSWWILSAGASVTAYLLAMTLVAAAESGARYALVRSRRDAPRLRITRPSAEVARSLVRPGLGFLAIGVGYRVVYSTDHAVISSIIGVAAIPAYAAAFRIFQLLKKFCASGIRALLPAAGMLDATGDRARLQGYVEHMTRASLGLAIAAGAGLALLGEPILSLWLGPGYSPGRPVIWILGALLPVAILVHSANTAVAAVGRHHRQAWIWVLEIVLNLGLSIPLAWEVGVAGVALGTLVARVLATPFYVGDAVSKLGLDLPRMLSRVLAPNLALLLLFMGWVWLLLGSGPSAPSHLALVSGGHLLISVASLAALVPREVRARMLVRLRRVLSV